MRLGSVSRYAMPSEKSAMPGDCFPGATSAEATSVPGSGPRSSIAEALVIAFPLLPPAPLQPEPGDHDRREQERHHRGRDGGALPEPPAQDPALVGQGRHEVGGVDRAAAGHGPDELEI